MYNANNAIALAGGGTSDDSPTMVQGYVQGATARAINCDAGTNGADGTYQTLAIALAPGSSGALPTGIYVAGIHHYNVEGRDIPNGPWTLQVPTYGNLLHISWQCLPLASTGLTGLSGMSDTIGSAYQTNCRPITNAADVSAGFGQHARAQGGTPSQTNKITLNSDQINANSVSHFVVYDIMNAATSAFDQCATTTGLQAVGGDLTAGALAPTNPNELLIGACGIDAHTISSLSPSGAGYSFDGGVAPNFDGAGTGFLSDDGFGHGAFTGTTSWVWATQNNSNGVQGWQVQVSAYIPAPT
jgi:hypothetical protein